MMNKKALYVAVAASFGIGAVANANAAAVTFASELPPTSSLAGTTWVAPTTAFAPSTANPLYLTFGLTAGSSFQTLSTASLACNGLTSGLTSAVTTAGMITLAAGGVGTAFATFIVTASSASVQISSCTITNKTALLGSSWPATVNETVSAVYGNAVAPSTTNSTALYTAASMFTNTVTTLTNTALVATGFITFGVTANTGTVASTAKIGNFKLLLNATNLSNGNAANGTALTATVTAITVSLGGTPLVASNGNATSGGLYITYDSAVAGTATCAGTILVSAAGGNSAITFSAVAPAAGGATSGYIYGVCMDVSGAVIPSGTITVGVVGTPNTDPSSVNASAYQISSLIASGTTLGTITRNGSSTEVLNLPPSTNADAGYLRVYNNSTGAGAVTITVYNEAGTALATTCTLSSSLAAQATMVQPVSAIEAACSITPPASGRYRAVVSGAFSTLRAQGMARNANGTLLNNSGDTSGMGN